MVVLSKAVWVQTFGFPKALFPYDNPALFSMAIAFVGIWLFSKSDASQRAREEQRLLRRAVRPVGDRHRRGLARTCTDGPVRRGRALSGSARARHASGHAERLRRPQSALRPPEPAGDRRARRRARHRLFPAGRGHRRAGAAPPSPARHHQGRGGGAGRRHARTRCSAPRTASTAARAGARRRRRGLHRRRGDALLSSSRKPVVLEPDPPQPGLRGLLLLRDLRASSTPSPTRSRAEGVESVLRARVREAQLRPGRLHRRRHHHRGRPATACAESDINALFVRDGGRIGVVTGMNLSKAVGAASACRSTPRCGTSAISTSSSVDADDFVFDALLLMTAPRQAPARGAARTATTSASSRTSTSSAWSPATPSSSPAGSTAPAASTTSPAPARDIQAQVERLHRQGVKVEAIAEITSDLNRRLFVKLFDLLRARLDPRAAAA